MRRRLVLALTLGLVPGAGSAVAGPVSEPAAWLSTYAWTEEDDRFGGMSAIEVDADGRGFVALSDRGSIVSGTLQRDAGGRISAVKMDRLEPLRGRDGAPLPRSRSDSEGLAIAPDGAIYVSFELAPRVLRYDRLFGAGNLLPIPRDFSRMQINGALEALAVAPDGALYTMPEVSIRNDLAFPVYRFRNGAWDQPFTLPSEGKFLPVGADFGPDGRLYVLERDFGVFGFSTRVRRFVVQGDTLGAGETVLQTRAGTHGDLEGISVWRDGAGQVRLTMIADNNFHSFLETQIVEYALQD